MKRKIEKLLKDEVKTESIKNIVKQIYLMDLYQDKFYICPGSKKHHHAWTGGLAQHTYEVMMGVKCITDTYPNLQNEVKDTLLLAAFMHDFGKMNIFYQNEHNDWTRSNIFDNNELKCASCMYGTMKIVDSLDIEENMYKNLKNYIYSHHGIKEWGSLLHVQDYKYASILFLSDYFSARDYPELTHNGEFIALTRLYNESKMWQRNDEELKYWETLMLELKSQYLIKYEYDSRQVTLTKAELLDYQKNAKKYGILNIKSVHGKMLWQNLQYQESLKKQYKVLSRRMMKAKGLEYQSIENQISDIAWIIREISK